MCTCVQADGFFPDSNEASCHHSPKNPSSLWVPSPCTLPASAQPSTAAQLGMTGTKLGNHGWRRSLTVPSMPFRNSLKATSYKQVRAGQPEDLDVEKGQTGRGMALTLPPPERLHSALLCPTGISDPGLERGIPANEGPRVVGKPSSQVVPGTPGAILAFPSPTACRTKDHDSHSPQEKTRDAEGQKKTESG